MRILPSAITGLLLFAWMLGAPHAQAAPVSQLEVRIVTGAAELVAGSTLELRIYEAGRNPRRFELAHGEAWPRDSTRLIPLTLSVPLDVRNVVRFGLTYRSAPVAPDEFEIVSAEIDVPSPSGVTQRLLDAQLSGSIARQGELATLEIEPAALQCKSDADCDDQRMCNGVERCAPHSPNADARGCVKGTPVVCPVNQVCGEGVGCRGLSPGSKP